MSEKKKVHIAVPHVSFDAMKKAVLGLFAMKKAGSAIEVMDLVDLNKTNTSKALSVARSLGFVEEISRGIYDLTESGKALARSSGYKKTDEVTEIVKRAIFNEDEWSEIVSFLRASMKNPRDPLDLVQFVESRMDKKWTPSMRSSLAGMYKSILIGGGLIDPSEPQIVSLLEIDDSETIEKLDFESDDKISTSDLEMANETKEDHFIFSKPDLFSFRVRASKIALQSLRKQIVDGTPLANWIDASLDALGNENE